MFSSWFLCAVIATVSWALADLFYKKGAETADKYSHLKTAVMVGLAMGIHGAVYMLIYGISFNPFKMLTYLPISLCYILSMVLGYVGLRYLELSISSPIQNSSGAVAALIMLIFFPPTLAEVFSVTGVMNIIGIIIITAGVVWLAFLEKRDDDRERVLTPRDKKYVTGLVAICFPILYCIFDSLGTALDGIYLDELAIVSEDEALLAYEFTFFIIAVLCFIYLTAIKKQKFSFSSEKNRGIAAVFETAGQVFYVTAMSGEAMIAAPLIASYCIFSVLLSRVFLKEKLSKLKYVTVALVMVGILILGLAEGIGESSDASAEDAVEVADSASLTVEE